VLDRKVGRETARRQKQACDRVAARRQAEGERERALGTKPHRDLLTRMDIGIGKEMLEPDGGLQQVSGRNLLLLRAVDYSVNCAGNCD
jgi:hypothetical protein